MAIWLIPLLCVVGLVKLWVDVLLNLRSVSQARTCGSCSYAVAGSTTMFCPECGSDYRIVGIKAPKSVSGVHPILFGVTWTLLLPLPVWVLCLLLIGGQGSPPRDMLGPINITAIIVTVPLYVVGWWVFIAVRRRIYERDAASRGVGAAIP